ncbi:hypothetical protein B0T24DRAFT_629851 [Lasiosphaeria ovina]|uniref:Post-SET domain-containing protein n=1 Tax=Lasiosphaeria ovina TaxID=92902 RepID=A0AAE0K7R8_9PEZI|nr:hypothetical protein B0T24DRAFT_629851 [Lasiosphaeria ovina]
MESDGIRIDGTNGSNAKFANHSCDPNSTIEKWKISGSTRFFLTSKTTILESQEVTFSYGDAFPLTKCLCGASKCLGWFGKGARKLGTDRTTQKVSQEHHWETFDDFVEKDHWGMWNGLPFFSPYFT